MSYILEALKKSEQERTRGIAPNLHSVHSEPFLEGRQVLWIYALAACVLLAAAAIAWQRPWQTERDTAKQPASPHAASAMPSQPPRMVPQAAPDRAPVAAMPEPPVQITARQEPPAPVAGDKKEPVVKAPSPVAETPAKTMSPTVPAAPSRPKVEPPAVPARPQDLVDFHELPASIRQALDKLVITGYVDSPADPSGQMIAIDNRLLRAGDEISPDLRLEQIAGGKAIFAYKGYRFRVSLP